MSNLQDEKQAAPTAVLPPGHSSIFPDARQTFTFHPTLQPFTLPSVAFQAANHTHYDGIAAGALIFDAQGRVLLIQRARTDSMPLRWECPGGAVDQDQADGTKGDASILHGCAREALEESGLVVTHIKRLVTVFPPVPQQTTTDGSIDTAAILASPDSAGGQQQQQASDEDKPRDVDAEGRKLGTVFTNSKGTRVYCYFAFEVEVESTERVKLADKEHEDYVWATEEEVNALEASGRKIDFAGAHMPYLYKEAFRLRNGEKRS